MKNEYLERIEEVFGERKKVINNETFELKFIEVSPVNKNPKYTFEIFMTTKVSDEIFAMIIESGTLEINHIKEVWESLNAKYNGIKKSTKEINVWPIIFLEELEGINVKHNCKESRFVIELEDLNKFIIIMNEFFIFENYDFPYCNEMYSYEDIGIVINLIKKEQFKLRMKNLY